MFDCSNASGEQQANNAFYNCIDSAPDIPERGKAVPLGLDMVSREEERPFSLENDSLRAFHLANDLLAFPAPLDDRI